MVTGVLRRLGDRYVVDVPLEEVQRLHLREGEAVTLELRPVGATTGDQPRHDASDSEDETAYLLRSPRNRERLLAALADAEHGQGDQLTLAEVRQELGLADQS